MPRRDVQGVNGLVVRDAVAQRVEPVHDPVGRLPLPGPPSWTTLLVEDPGTIPTGRKVRQIAGVTYFSWHCSDKQSVGDSKPNVWCCT